MNENIFFLQKNRIGKSVSITERFERDQFRSGNRCGRPSNLDAQHVQEEEKLELLVLRHASGEKSTEKFGENVSGDFEDCRQRVRSQYAEIELHILALQLGERHKEGIEEPANPFDQRSRRQENASQTRNNVSNF